MRDMLCRLGFTRQRPTKRKLDRPTVLIASVSYPTLLNIAIYQYKLLFKEQKTKNEHGKECVLRKTLTWCYATHYKSSV